MKLHKIYRMKKNSLLVLCLWISFSTLAQKNKKKTHKPIAEHVILIGLDGWGAYSMAKADMPNVRALMEKGSYTLKKRSVLPSSSAINWASMFMGVSTELHGYTTWNAQKPEIPSRVIVKNNISPTIFQLLRDARPNTEIGVIYEWEGIKYLTDTLSLNYFALAKDYKKHPFRLTQMAEKYIKSKKPTLMAVIYDNPDYIGHSIGYGTPEYYTKLHEIDAYIGRIIQAMKDSGIYGKSIIILSSDHGGTKKGHEGHTLAELETPFIIAGKGVKNLGAFEESMMQFDIAATIAHILGLQQPQVWIGRPMLQVFK